MPRTQQDNLILYKAIFNRKSIRKYNMEPLDPDVLSRISDFIQGLQPMKGEKEIEATILLSEHVKAGLQASAPHYVCISADRTQENLLNIGFMFEQLCLYLFSLGLGSCWQGIPKPTAEIKKTSKYEFIILIAFGKPKDALPRQGTIKHSRKAINEITDIKVLDSLIESARLAPSAINNQPWYFTGDANMVHVHCKGQGIIKKLLVEKYNMIDIGITLSHLWLAVRNEGREVAFVTDKALAGDSPKGYYYVVSMKL